MKYTEIYIKIPEATDAGYCHKNCPLFVDYNLDIIPYTCAFGWAEPVTSKKGEDKLKPTEPCPSWEGYK
jgi:hypothetical protein